MKSTFAILAALLSLAFAAPTHKGDGFPDLDVGRLGGIMTGGVIGEDGSKQVASIIGNGP